MARNRQKEVKAKKMLLTIWFIFLIALATLGFFLYKKRKSIKEDFQFSTRFSYQTNANQDINALIISYLNAYASCDQDLLKSCVTDPSKFDDMTNVQSQSKVITAYTNINCYTVSGFDDSATIVYPVTNISILDVSSTPLDIPGPFYVVNQNGQYLIDNTELSEEVKAYMDKVDGTDDIQALYKMVKDDEDKCAEEDPTFKDFMDRLK